MIQQWNNETQQNILVNPHLNQHIQYFDKQDPEEEDIIYIKDEIYLRYQNLEKLYNEIVPLDYYESAKKKAMSEIVRTKSKSDKKFTYGEMTFRTISYTFQVIRQKFGEDAIKKGDFYDLGSVSTKLIRVMEMFVCKQLLSTHFKI